jgi:hypothetical protein
MEVPHDLPAVFHLRSRPLILVAAPPIALLCISRVLVNLRSGESWLNWLSGLVLWLFLLFLALRRRLVLTGQGLEYTEFFTTARVPWAQVTRLVSRKSLGIWPVEGLEAWTQAPKPKDIFVELTQFHRSWRHAPLGAKLAANMPHLFQGSGTRMSAG